MTTTVGRERGSEGEGEREGGREGGREKKRERVLWECHLLLHDPVQHGPRRAHDNMFLTFHSWLN